MAGPWEKYASQDGPWTKYSAPQASQSATTAADIPGGGLAGNRNAGQPDTSSFMDKAKGVGEAALTAGTGIFGAAAGGAASLGRMVTGLSDIALNGQQNSQANQESPEDTFKRVTADNTYAPRSAKGKEYTWKMGDFMQDSGIVGLPMGEGMQAGRSLPKAGMVKTAIAESPEAAMLAKGAQSVGDKLPKMNIKLTPEMAELNRKARDFGITLQPHQVSDNKFIKIIGETLNHIPASGAKTAQNQMALERALIGQIGGDTKAAALTPKVFDQAMRRSGTTIDGITRRNTFVADSGFMDRLTKVKEEAGRLETGDNARVIAGWVDEITGKIENGQMSGTQFRKLNSKLGAKIRSTDSDLKNGLSDLQDALLEQFNESIAGPDREAFLHARTRYAKAKALAPVVGDPKGVSGSKLLSAVRNTKENKERYARGNSGDMGDLADIGQILKDPNTSLTGERNLVYGGLGAASGLLAGAVNPMIGLPAAGLYGAANIYNRIGPLFIPKKP